MFGLLFRFQSFEIVRKLDCPDPEIQTRYIIKFTMVSLENIVTLHCAIIHGTWTFFVYINFLGCAECVASICWEAHQRIQYLVQSGENRMHSDEQHTATESSTGETLRNNGWRRKGDTANWFHRKRKNLNSFYLYLEGFLWTQLHSGWT